MGKKFAETLPILPSMGNVINPQTAGVPYTEQHPKTKENDVKTILLSLAYVTLIKLPFCMTTGKREIEIFHKKKKKKKKSKSVRNHFTIKKMIKNGKKKKTKIKDLYSPF